MSDQDKTKAKARAILAANKKNGEEFQQVVGGRIDKTGRGRQDQVIIENSQGRAVLDHLIQRPDGQLRGVEDKGSASARYRRSQRAVYEEVARTGATVVSSKSGLVKPGDSISAHKIATVRPDYQKNSPTVARPRERE